MDVVTYALLKSDIGGLKTLVESLQQGLDYKGSVATVDDLPNDAASGDSYTVTENGGQYIYDGTEWVRLNQDLVDKVSNYFLNLADDYDPTATYAVGAYCIRNNLFYRCSTAITTAEAWTAGHWTQTTVGAELLSVIGMIPEVPEVDPIPTAQIDTLFE